MLRGQSSLQQLIGKNPTDFKKQKKGVQARRKAFADSAAKDVDAPEALEPVVPELNKQLSSKTSAELPPVEQSRTNRHAKRQRLQSESPKVGKVQCPVCKKFLEAATDVNSHIDDCLIKSSARKGRSSPPDGAVQATSRAVSPMECEGQPATPPSTDAASPNGITSPFKKMARRSRAGPAPDAAEVLITFKAHVTARRYVPPAIIEPGLTAYVRHEPGNAKDQNALQVVSDASQATLGYLPGPLAALLAPLVIPGFVRLSITFLEAPRTATSPVPIQLQVSNTAPPGHNQEQLKKDLEKAATAGESLLQRAGSGTGEALRANFLLVSEMVQDLDAHLFREPEQAFLAKFRGLPAPAQALFLRLFQRRGPWFQARTFSYSEVEDAAAAVQQLVEAGLARTDANADTEARSQIAETIKSLEMQILVAKLGLLPPGAKSRSKGQLAELLLPRLLDPDCNEAWAAVLEMTGPCVALDPGACEVVRRINRLFFLNEGQGLSHVQVADMGILKYPPYKVWRTRPAFQDRAALDAYELALRHAARLDHALEAGDLAAAENALEPARAALAAGMHKAPAGSASEPTEAAERGSSMPFLMRYTAGWIYTAMATAGVSLLEKQRRYDDAAAELRQLLGGVCCPGRRGEWWVRLSLDIEHCNRPEESLEVAEAALADEWVKHGDRITLQRRALRLGKPPRRWKRPSWAESALWEPPETCITGKLLAGGLGLKSRFVGLDSQECTVESLALQFYASEAGGSWLGIHSENGIWSTLFGLLMWDVLYMPVPDVFRTAFQTGPMDLGTPVFLLARRAAAAEAVRQVSLGRGPQKLQEVYAEHRGVMACGVNWDRHSVEDLCTIATCIGGAGLATVCQLLAEDHSGWSGGMPDLLLWKPNQMTAKLAEVERRNPAPG
ncbi:hypothetical protein WJX84_006907 [Apatococcus fuscideae]|uniref:Fanconi-associated nuclease n=1 Tax=Apatococcus fuscideae TaxID=2026836 RepID=A0AAW1T9Q4_9CHLO